MNMNKHSVTSGSMPGFNHSGELLHSLLPLLSQRPETSGWKNSIRSVFNNKDNKVRFFMSMLVRLSISITTSHSDYKFMPVELNQIRIFRLECRHDAFFLLVIFSPWFLMSMQFMVFSPCLCVKALFIVVVEKYIMKQAETIWKLSLALHK